MDGLKRWAPLVAALVLILRTLGLQEWADAIDASQVDVLAAVGVLAGVAMKFWSIYRKRQARRNTVAPRP